MPPWLSVLIPTFNGEKYLPSALDTILVQGEYDIEYIVVDDGSTDSTLSILDAYKTKFSMRVLQRKRQGNWVASTNYALSLATGKYACFLHQDDLWHKNRLRTMKRLIHQFPAVDFFLHSSCFIDEKGNPLGLWNCPLPRYPEVIEPGSMTGKLLIQNFISIPAPIFKRETALRLGGLDEFLWYTADWDLWLKMSLHARALYYPEPLSGFRVHPNSQTMARSSYLHDFRKQLVDVFNKNFELWDASDSLKRKTYKSAIFSIEVNTSLAGILHQKDTNIFGLLIKFILLGPTQWHSYLVNSRILERVGARLKTQLMARFK
jgi:glycosyltransferase involved in cell wall biosynthesis